MSSLALRALTVLLLLAGALTGCSGANDQNTFDPDRGTHASDWLPARHMNSANADLAGCGDCHGADLNGGITRLGCDRCHMGGATSVHPAGWVRDACYNHGAHSIAAGTAACANAYCHGADLGGVAGSGPACTACHAMPHMATCGSCHAIPPATGSHALHMDSAVMATVVCGTCHAAGCDKHDNGTADVAISPTYYARSAGTVTFTGSTCFKVSCHGGQTTPAWTGGTINVNTQCSACHSFGTAEYNSYSSGEHALHVSGEGISCTQCHDTALLAVNHFRSLQTPAMEGPAAGTILPSIGYDGRTCANPCHDPEQWR